MQQKLSDSSGAGSVKPAGSGLRIVCSGYSTGRPVPHPVLDGATRFSVMVSGSTYPHRDVLKGFGMRWDAAQKLWKGTVDRTRLQQVEKMNDVRLCVIPRKESENRKESEADNAPAPPPPPRSLRRVSASSGKE